MKKIIVICLVLIIFFGFIIPYIFTDSLDEIDNSYVVEAILSFPNNYDEKFYTIGYVVEECEHEGHQYEVKVKTWFGFTYSNIFIYNNR